MFLPPIANLKPAAGSCDLQCLQNPLVHVGLSVAFSACGWVTFRCCQCLRNKRKSRSGLKTTQHNIELFAGSTSTGLAIYCFCEIGAFATSTGSANATPVPRKRCHPKFSSINPKRGRPCRASTSITVQGQRLLLSRDASWLLVRSSWYNCSKSQARSVQPAHPKSIPSKRLSGAQRRAQS